MDEVKIFFANFQILGPLGCQGWVVIPQNVKMSKSLHPNTHTVITMDRTSAQPQVNLVAQ
jgi:hypothetical protein